MNVLHIVPEVTPFAATGALADICAALPRALAREPGVRCAAVMPRYRSINPERHALARRLSAIEVTLGGKRFEINVFEGRLPGGGVPLYLIDHPLFDRDGLYGENGVDYPDNPLRFALLGKAALEVAKHVGAHPDLVHAHDWQGALAAVYARRERIPSVITVHNLALQGLTAREQAGEIDVEAEADGGMLGDKLSLLKLGLAAADRIVTVSPRYARDIQTPEGGGPLHTLLRERRVLGILNGIDTELWDPARDGFLSVHYDAQDQTGKAACKAALQRELRLPARAQVPLFASVSRLIDQKGIATILDAGDEIGKLELQIVFHGTGEKKLEVGIENLARRYPTKIVYRRGHEVPLTHRIFAAADFYLMPSKLEPCGLAQMVAFRYGALPIVRATGGLDDTVVDHDARTQTGTGFKFGESTGSALAGCVKRALTVYHHKQQLDAMVPLVMKIDHGWALPASRYAEIYAALAPKKKQ
jgi:starch synthase